MPILWLDRSHVGLAEALGRRLSARKGSAFNVAGLEACRDMAAAILSALRADLVEDRREAVRTVLLELVTTMMPRGLGYADLRFFGQSLRTLVLDAADGDDTLGAAARRRLDDWLFEAVLISSTYFFAQHEALSLERAALDEVRQLEAQLDKLKAVNDSLEARVRERTADLEAKNTSLATALSDLQRTQEQLIHSEKMASLGLLVAGIAHEIKNPLNFVNNFAELSLEFVDEIERLVPTLGSTAQGQTLVEILSELADNLRRIHEHGRRADMIINAMSVHAREPTAKTESINLNELVRTHAALAYQGFRARDRAFKLDLFEELDRELDVVTLAHQDLSRVILNLVANACHALRERQRRAATDYRPALRLTTRRAGDTAVIRVEDNGTGIPAEVRRRIFDPFFTTKPPGEGTGLGLSMSYDIVVKQLGGQIAVESREGEGTQFTVILPAGPPVHRSGEGA